MFFRVSTVHMSSQLALYHYDCGAAEVRECEIPEPTSSEVLVKVAAVALSPIDWKILHGSKPSVPTILGCDFAGTVTCVGDAVTKIKIGERVIGFVAGGNPLRPTDGAFAQYVAAPAHMILRLPNSMSFEDGASLPSPLFVGGLSLYKCLSIPYPPFLGDKAIKEPLEPDESKLKEVLIYGGGTATGSMQIQLAKLSGLTVYTVCSQESFELVKRCGADYVFYHDDPTTLPLLRSTTQGKIEASVDCIATKYSAAICATNMEVSGGKYISFTAQNWINDPRITVIRIFGFTMMKREFLFESKGIRAEINHDDVNFAVNFSPLAEQLITTGAIKHGAVEVRPGGLNAICSGLDDLKSGGVNRKRIVYPIEQNTSGPSS